MGDRAAELIERLRALVSEWRAPYVVNHTFSRGVVHGIGIAADDLERLLNETESEQGAVSALRAVLDDLGTGIDEPLTEAWQALMLRQSTVDQLERLIEERRAEREGCE